MATESESAVLIGFIVAIVVVGIAGGVTLTVFICLKYHEYQKRRAMTRVVPCRRSRRSRGNRRRNSIHHGGPAFVERPPAYTEVENDPPPPYTGPGILVPQIQRDGVRRDSISSSLTPVPQRRRNPHFGTHLNTGTANTPMVTPTGSMFRSSLPGTRQTSATSNARSINMVHFDNEIQTSQFALNLALNIENSGSGQNNNSEHSMDHG